MKKLFILSFIFAFATASFGQNGYRYTVVPGIDNTYALEKKEIATPAYAATLSLTPNAEVTTYDIGALTGAITLNLAKTSAYTGDRVILILRATTSTRTLTWGTYITPLATTLSVTTAKSIVVLLVFDGATWVQAQ